ncbi:hypothetical protein CBL_01890 [Carabus blaptoides fortunei]
MSSCPFRRASSHVLLQNGGGGSGRDGQALGNLASRKPGGLSSRQSSFQIADDTEDEDQTTLNLKHLSSAVQLLTSPPESRQKHRWQVMEEMGDYQSELEQGLRERGICLW